MKLVRRRRRNPGPRRGLSGDPRACGPEPPLQLIHDLLSDYGYLAAFTLVFAAGAGLPSPGALVLVIAGALVTRGYYQFEALLPLLIAANVAGDLVMYGMARRMTGRETWARRCAKHPWLERLERSLKRRPTRMTRLPSSRQGITTRSSKRS